MTEENKESPDTDTPQTEKEPPSPDDLVHMYGGFLYVIVPVVLIALLAYWLMK